jgi:hypothetical protein
MMWNDDYYYVLEDEFGPARAKLVAESHRDSITEVEKVRHDGNLGDFVGT